MMIDLKRKFFQSVGEIIDIGPDCRCIHNLVALVVMFEVPHSEITLVPEWLDIPLAFCLSAMGGFREIYRQMDVLKTMNARLFSPPTGLTIIPPSVCRRPKDPAHYQRYGSMHIQKFQG